MFRAATEHDLLALTELERDANLMALTHVFPPDRYPFPFDAVLTRWRLVLDDPAAVVLVEDETGGGLAAYVAYDDQVLRHVAVHPDHWGRGLATAGIGAAVAAMRGRGSTAAFLWVLMENHRARRLYEHLGWAPTRETREAPWPPYPIEIRYTLTIPTS